jgi:hypothetical protein
MANAIAGHHRAAARATFAPVASSDPATACGRTASRSTSTGNHQGKQTTDHSSDQEPKTHRENPRKDCCHQAGVDTLSKGVGEHMWVLVRRSVCVARTRDLLRATVILQCQGEAEKAPGRGAATKHEVTQSSSNHPALSMTQRHQPIIGRLFGLLN